MIWRKGSRAIQYSAQHSTFGEIEGLKISNDTFADKPYESLASSHAMGIEVKTKCHYKQ